MNKKIREDLEKIALNAVKAVRPTEAVKRALEHISFQGDIYLVACGKAAWEMADTAVKSLQHPLKDGIVITKYGHVMNSIKGVRCFEAGHPIPTIDSFLATDEVLKMTKNLKEEDTVLFLLSGGGSSLFESPACSLTELATLTKELLEKGADIVEMNTIRKRLSNVKGGKFAKWCFPAKVEAIVLSDILGDPLDMIASGPCAVDETTCEKALEIASKYQLTLNDHLVKLLNTETVKELKNVHTQIIGSVKELCKYASLEAQNLGYEVVYLTDYLNTEAKDAGCFLSAILKSHANDNKNIAFITGGETVVHVRGNGLGGRNQELALSASINIDGLNNVGLISVGSDGTDGPTDAAGGYVDGDTLSALKSLNINVIDVLNNNDSYNALKLINGLIFTGPTGTNVNDVTIGIVRKEEKKE